MVLHFLSGRNNIFGSQFHNPMAQIQSAAIHSRYIAVVYNRMLNTTQNEEM